MLFDDPFFVRNLVYGLEDSLISTSGVIVGVTFAGFPVSNIIITGIVLILVEALSMGYGSLVSEESFLISSKKKYTSGQIFLYAFTMFASYVAAGIAVLMPYILNLKYNYIYTIAIAITLLFIILFFIHKNVVKALVITILGAIILLVSVQSGRMLEIHNGNSDIKNNH